MTNLWKKFNRDAKDLFFVMGLIIVEIIVITLSLSFLSLSTQLIFLWIALTINVVLLIYNKGKNE